MADNKELVEQPKPQITLNILEEKISKAYELVLEFTKHLPVKNDNLTEANGILQELLMEIIRCKENLQPIDIESNVSNELMNALGTEKVQFHVCGVQLIENGKLQGTSLYSTIIKARQIRDILNKRFAELNVKHEAKILSYPVY